MSKQRLETRAEAVEMARALRAKGRTYAEIAEALSKRGWRAKTGGPCTVGGVASLLNTPMTWLERKKAASSEDAEETSTTEASVSSVGSTYAAAGDRAMLGIVRKLLRDDNIPPEGRISACLVLLDSHLGHGEGSAKQ